MTDVPGVKRHLPALGWGLCAAALLSMIAGAILQEARGGDIDQGLAEQIGLLLGFASFPVLGALIAAKQPGNALGWIFLGVGVSIGVLLMATEYAYLSLVERREGLPLGIVAIWLEQWLWYPALGLIATFGLLLFPNGKPPPGRFWRAVAWVSGGTLVTFAIGATLQEGFESEGGFSIENPVGLGLPHVEEALGPVFAVFGVCAVLSAFSLVVRFWRSRGDERQQLKVLTMAAVFVVAVSAAGDLLELPGYIFPLTLWMIPGAVALAIFKHRLYDIDAIVNRTLVYGVLTAILGLVYLGAIVLLQQLLGGVTGRSDLTIAGSTLAVAGLFGPLRGRVQRFIDRRFYRQRYNASHTLETFSSRLRDDVDLHHMTQDLAAVVRETMQPAHVSVWLKPSSGRMAQP